MRLDLQQGDRVQDSLVPLPPYLLPLDDEDALLKHDIMAHDETGRKHNFFKQAKNFDMYAYVDDKPKFDDYGEVLNYDDFMTEVVPAPSAEEMPDAAPAMDTAADEPVAAPIKKVVPTKCAVEKRTIELHCSVSGVCR